MLAKDVGILELSAAGVVCTDVRWTRVLMHSCIGKRVYDVHDIAADRLAQ